MLCACDRTMWCYSKMESLISKLPTQGSKITEPSHIFHSKEGIVNVQSYVLEYVVNITIERPQTVVVSTVAADWSLCLHDF